VRELTITMDASSVADITDGEMPTMMRSALSRGVRDSLAVVESVHKRQVIGKGGGPVKDDVWTERTREASRSFHRDHSPGDLAGAYGSALARVGVLEMGTQEALGGPLRPRRGRYLTIPTEAARVGVGRAVAARDRNDLFFVVSRSGTPVLLQKGTGKLMFVLRTQVTIPPRPTLALTQDKAQPKVDAIMLAASTSWMRGGK